MSSLLPTDCLENGSRFGTSAEAKRFGCTKSNQVGIAAALYPFDCRIGEHGTQPVTGAAVYWHLNLDQWQQSLRQMADNQRQNRLATTETLAVAWHTIAEWALRLLSGILAGFGAGYISHVALDFGTPRCLPLMMLRGQLR